jgi:hypothetical protein
MAMNAFALGSDQLTEGWLTKEAVGKTGMWRKRWFVFRNNAVRVSHIFFILPPNN